MNNFPSAAGTNGALIHISDLTKSYQTETGAIQVLKNVNLKIYPGEIVAVMGPSGSGKSTLLFILGIFISPTGGTYILGGEDVLRLDRDAQAEFRRNRVGFVFQSCDLLEHSTVYENLEYPLIYAGVDRRDRPARITAALELVNLGHRMHHSSNRLSGGERQRVAVARALVNQPQFILADEPTGNLDSATGEEIMLLFDRLQSAGNTIVLVTHEHDIAAHANRIIHIRDGKIARDERVR